MRIGLFIKKLRKELGISAVDFAKKIGITTDTLSDFEGFDDDEINGFTIPELKRMCDTLKIAPASLFQSNIKEYGKIDLAELLIKRREERKISRVDLSDQIGYEESVIEALENNMNKDRVCFEAIKKVSSELDIPLEGRIPIFTVMQLTMTYVNWPFVSGSSIVLLYSMSAA